MRNMEPGVLVKNNLVDRHFGYYHGKLIRQFDSVAWLASFHIVCVGKMSFGQMAFDQKEMYWSKTFCLTDILAANTIGQFNSMTLSREY
jgi:hypothetical protein